MEIDIDTKYGADDIDQAHIRSLAHFVLMQEQVPPNTEVSISFVDNEEIARMNEHYRKKPGPTDVLSFECDSLDDEFSACKLDDAPFELGDVIMAPDVAREQCEQFGNSFEQEVELLLTHGLLHLCGYDHIQDDEARIMQAREREILEAWRKA